MTPPHREAEGEGCEVTRGVPNPGTPGCRAGAAGGVSLTGGAGAKGGRGAGAGMGA